MINQNVRLFIIIRERRVKVISYNYTRKAHMKYILKSNIASLTLLRGDIP